LRARAAHGHARAVEQLRLEVPAGVGPERAHVVEVHEVRAVHAREAARVETGLEPAQREMQHVARAPLVGDHVIAVGLEPRHALDRHGDECPADPHEQPADRPTRERAAQPLDRVDRYGLAERGPHALHGGRETRGTEGLEQVVHRAELEGAHRVLGVGRGEDDERQPVGAAMREPAQHLGAQQSRHLHVEEDELRAQRVDAGDRGLSVGGLADDVHPVECAKHRAQPRARDRLVVDDERSDLHAVLLRRRGTTSTASYPPSASGRHASRASLP
jgi:hypothetical protein